MAQYILLKTYGTIASASLDQSQNLSHVNLLSNVGLREGNVRRRSSIPALVAQSISVQSDKMPVPRQKLALEGSGSATRYRKIPIGQAYNKVGTESQANMGQLKLLKSSRRVTSGIMGRRALKAANRGDVVQALPGRHIAPARMVGQTYSIYR